MLRAAVLKSVRVSREERAEPALIESLRTGGDEEEKEEAVVDETSTAEETSELRRQVRYEERMGVTRGHRIDVRVPLGRPLSIPTHSAIGQFSTKKIGLP